MIPTSRFKRLAAFIIDAIILWTIGFSLCLIALLILNAFINPGNGESLSVLFLMWSFVGLHILVLLYFALFESSKYQATPGKKLLNLYVSNLDNQKISLMRSLYRSLLFLLLLFLTSFIFLVIYMNEYSGLEFYFLGFTIWIIWIGPIFFTKSKITLCDILSFTRVNSDS